MAVNNLQRQETRSKVPFLLSFLIIFILVHDFVPIVGFKTPELLFAGVVVLSYVFSTIVMGSSHFFDLLRKILPLFLLNFLQLLHHMIIGHEGVFTELYGLAQYLIVPLFSLYVLEKKDIKLAKLMMAIIIICCIITSITTYYGCLVFPNASRDLATTIRSNDDILYATYMLLNIGGFNFIYTVVLLIPFVIYLAKDNKLNFVLAVLIIVVFMFAIRQSEYTTALLLSIMGLFSFFLHPRMEWRRMRKYIILIVVGGIVFSEVVPSMLRYVATSVGSEQVSSRLSDLADVVAGNETGMTADSDLGSRQDNVKKSWDTFVRSSFLGGWSQAKVGGHSYFFDALGRYGVIGLILLMIMYVRLYKLYFKPFKSKPWFGCTILVLFLAIIQATINTGNSFSCMCLILPLFYLIVEKNKE